MDAMWLLISDWIFDYFLKKIPETKAQGRIQGVKKWQCKHFCPFVPIRIETFSKHFSQFKQQILNHNN